MFESRNFSATMNGTPTFIAQVSDGLPLAPNLCPAMKTTCLVGGRRSSCSRSRRSHATHSMPQPSSFSRSPFSEKRATPMTRLPARRARRASVGPILPPTPSTMTSSMPASSRSRSGLGRVMNSSSAATSSKRAGQLTIWLNYNSAMPRILTTVVGSYPMPDWLVRAPSEQALLDATRVVIATQERAGIDVVADGELYRFDVNHPETNGMIEYFVRPMSGVRSDIGFSEWLDYSKGAGMRFRTRPPGVVEGKIAAGTLNLKLPCARAKALATKPLKFKRTRPHMLAKTLHERHYKNEEKLAQAIADVLAEQVKYLDADVVQVDEVHLPGHPEEWQWAAATMNQVLKAVPKKAKSAVHLCFGNYGGQSI